MDAAVNTAPKRDKTFKARDIRQFVAFKYAEGFNAEHLNPLVGHTPEKTLANIANVMGLLHHLIDGDESIDDIRPGIALLVQTVWSATQYEESVSKENEVTK